MSAQKAKEKEVAEVSGRANGDRENESNSDASDDEDPTAAGGESVLHASTPSTSSKKKRKKRSKAIQALNALRGNKDSLPQDVVNVVMEKVRAEGGEVAANADEATIRAALEHMKLKDVLQGKAGIGGKNRKDAGDHKVQILSSGDFVLLNDRLS